MRIKAVFTVVLTAAIAIGYAAEGQDLEWKGSRTNEKGFIEVRNPIKPVYEGRTLGLEAIATYGYSKDESEAVISGVRDFFVDDNGNVYVLDARDSDIKKFDGSGAFLTKFGRPGQGPGDLSRPYMLFQRGNEREVGVLELMSRRMSFFDFKGSFVKSIPTTEMLVNKVRSDSEGNFIIGTATIGQDERRYTVKKLDTDMNHLRDVASSPSPIRGDPFSPLVVWELMPNGSVAFAYPSDYQITIYTSDGTIEKRMLKEYKPMEVTEEEKRIAKREIPPSIEYKPSKYRSAFRDLFVDEKGRLFVLTWEEGSRPGTGVFDIFDQEGRYIYKVELPGKAICWKHGNLYTVESNEQDFTVIRKYRVSWNSD